MQHSRAFPMGHAPQQPRQNMFTLVNIAKNLAFIGVMVGINRVGAPGNLIFFAILSVMCLKNSESAFKAISLCMLVLVSNSAFVVKSGMVFAPMRFIILFIAVGKIFMDLNASGKSMLSHKYYVALCGFVGVSGILAILGGYFVHISLLKLLSFLVGMSVILAGAEMSRRRGSDLTCWFYSIMVFTVVMGIVAWGAGVGYNAKTEFAQYSGLFNGPFFHPQTLGPVCALMITYLLCVALFTPYGKHWLSFALIAVLLLFLYKTSSRTAVIALAAGVGSSFFFGFMLQRKGQYFVRLNFSKAQIIGMCVLGGIVIAVGDVATGFSISSKAREYIMKGGDQTLSKTYGALSTTDALMSTRQGQIDMMMAGIKQRPLTGIGFGTSSDASFANRASLLSAPTEKGFLPLAIVEETGFIGGFFFTLFVLLFYLFLIKERNIPGLGMFTALLGCNIGEMSFFSFGGQGAFLWVLVGAGIALGAKCITRRGPAGSPMMR